TGARVAHPDPRVVVAGGDAERAGLDDRLREGKVTADMLSVALDDVEARHVVDRGARCELGLGARRVEPPGKLRGGEPVVAHDRYSTPLVEQRLLLGAQDVQLLSVRVESRLGRLELLQLVRAGRALVFELALDLVEPGELGI